MNPPLQKNIKPKRIHWITKLVALLVMIALGLGIYLNNQLGPVNINDNVDRMFEVHQGTTSMQIAKNLEKEGLLKNTQAFIIYNRLTGKTNKLKAGHFLLNPTMSAQEITTKLVEGKVATISFTIPEGYTLKQIAEVLVKKEISTDKEFWTVVKEGEFEFPFLQDLPQTDNRLEGYLFPDTYKISLGMSTKNVIKMMLKRFEAVYKQLPPNNTGLSTHEVVILASIVEGECLLDRERPIIASVFFNRLKIGQRLEACATVQYALGKRTAKVLIEDTKTESPYNTYLHEGLPPGPIGCPGEASLKSVLEPADTEYYYFVAKTDNSGEHVFSKTFAEHKSNKWKLGY